MTLDVWGELASHQRHESTCCARDNGTRHVVSTATRLRLVLYNTKVQTLGELRMSGATIDGLGFLYAVSR